MRLLKVFDFLLFSLFLSWVVWLFKYNPDQFSQLDIFLGGGVFAMIVKGYQARKALFADSRDIKILGSTWRLLVSAVGLPVAGYFLYFKIPVDDSSARLVLWIIYLTFIYDICLRINAWYLLKETVESKQVNTDS